MKPRNKQSQQRASGEKAKSSGNGLNSLRDLFIEELRDLYDAEHQLVKALPKIAAAVSSSDLKETIEAHLEQTRGHVKRLEQVFKGIGEQVRSTHCDAMAGLLKEGKKMTEKHGEEAVVDAGIITAAQRVEHYEIAGYGCACAFAKRLGYDDSAELLSQTLDEEKKADEKLTEISESSLELSERAVT
jgi:ferritin-like metal-binding protein YciE